MTEPKTGRRAVIALSALGLLAACGGGTPQAHSQPQRSMMEVLASDSSFERVVEAATRSGLPQSLGDAGPFTVFAFTNSGWADLPAFLRQSLLDPSEGLRLTPVMGNLVVDGKHSIASLGGQRREFATRADTRLAVDATDDARLRVESAGGSALPAGAACAGLRSARLIRKDIEASNGVIHVLSQITVP
jgi:uncharacterized surface protein with fasciclin (FAS1) repeats